MFLGITPRSVESLSKASTSLPTEVIRNTGRVDPNDQGQM